VQCTLLLGVAAVPAGAARVKKAEQMSDEELKQALPSMLFTTSNLIWSSEWGAVLAWQQQQQQ
jgi:hypothetical protein